MDWHNAAQALLPTLMESRLKSWGLAEINVQQDCLFYNGRIPQEITDLIFEFALSPDTLPGPQSDLDPRHDFCVRFDHERSNDEPEPEPATQQDEAAGTSISTSSHVGSQVDGDVGFDTFIVQPEANSIPRKRELGFDWFRPDNTGRVDFSGHELLRTCRRVYLDTNKLLGQARDVIVYSGRESPWGRGLNDFISRLQQNYPHQLPKTHSIRWFAQMYLLGIAPVEPVWRTFHNLEHFHLTIRRTDWDRWEDNKPLAINPYRRNSGEPQLPLMRRDMHASMVEGEQPQHDISSTWSTMFRAMYNLKSLTISFETSEDKKDEMEEIVAWARTWRFDVMSRRYWMKEDGDEPEAYLVAEDKPARRMSWRGLKHHWSDFCSACGAGEEVRPDCGHCLKKHKLVQQNKGPRLLVWTMTWRPEPVDRSVDLRGKDTGPSGLP